MGSANALRVALSLDRRSLHVAQWGSGSLSNFQIERSRSLTALQAVPAAQPTSTDSAQVVVSRSRRRAYMTNFNAGAAGTLSIYNVAGQLQALATIPTVKNLSIRTNQPRRLSTAAAQYHISKSRDLEADQDPESVSSRNYPI
jgi:hypothetical protein